MRLPVLFLIALTGFSVAEEGRPDKASANQVIRGLNRAPWLGLKVGRLDEAIRAQLPKLPEGIGFVVASVDPGGPAEKAGVKPYDIFWKLGDQWIANEAQLFTLIRLQKAGDEVALGVYRSGQELTVPVVLAAMPDERVLGVLPPLERPADPAGIPEVPIKVLNPAERTAQIDAADGKVVLSLVAGTPEVKIVSSDATVIYEGPVNDLNGVSLVPDPWKPRVGALERALAHAMKGNFTPRVPRTRVLPAASEEDK
jgi:hypothetical protein